MDDRRKKMNEVVVLERYF